MYCMVTVNHLLLSENNYVTLAREENLILYNNIESIVLMKSLIFLQYFMLWMFYK